MKKQILILLLAIFAIGFSSTAFGQTPHDPPTCNGDASSPAPGINYTYEVTIPNDGGYTGAGTFDWYVMEQGQLNLLTGAHIPAANTEFIASGHYDIPTASANTINITWTAEALATAQPYFLVVVYEETTVCATNNMKVYRIEPQNTFWLAIDNVTTVQCAAAITDATIVDINNPGEVTYTYGTNTMEIEITAGGYTGDWDAQLQIGGFDAGQTLTIAWAAAVAGTAGTFTDPGSGNNGTWTAELPSSTTGVAPALVNETITITITVANNQFENLAGQTIDLAIDGSYTSGGTTFQDLSDVNGNCTPESAFADAVQQTISARPTITPVTPAAFVPQTP
jgi:hypothetical protein